MQRPEIWGIQISLFYYLLAGLFVVCLLCRYIFFLLALDLSNMPDFHYALIFLFLCVSFIFWDRSLWSTWKYIILSLAIPWETQAFNNNKKRAFHCLSINRWLPAVPSFFFCQERCNYMIKQHAVLKLLSIILIKVKQNATAAFVK